MQLDFNGIKTAFKEKLTLTESWASTLFYGLIERLIDATAYVMEKLVNISEFNYRESNLGTAQTYKGINRQVQWLSYIPKRKRGASGTIDVSGDPTFNSAYNYTGENVIVPRWTEFSNEDENVFVYCTEETIYYKNTIGNQSIPVKEGQIKTYLYTAIGEANETISIYGLNTDHDEFQVDIVDTDETVLSSVNICGKNDNPEKLYFVTDTDSYYVEINNSDDFEETHISFGDNIYGRQVTSGEKIKITYAETQGDEGNITLSNIITKIKSDLVDSNNEAVTLYAKNTEEISNGNGLEDIEDIRNYAPRLFISGYRAGGADDWVTLLEDHPYIYKAQIQNAEDIGSTDPLDKDKVFVTAVSTDGSVLTSPQKSEVTLNFKEDNKKSITEIISWNDPQIVFIKWNIEATVINQPFTIINTTIKDNIEDTYGILNIDFAENIYESNYIRMLDNLSDIIYHVTNVRYLEKGLGITAVDKELIVSVTTGDNEDQIILQADTLEIWLHRKIDTVWGDPFRIAYDSAGTLVGEQGDLSSGIYNIIDQGITYSSNLVSYSIETILSNPGTYGVSNPSDDNPTGYIVSLAYKTEDANGNQQRHLRLPSKQFIFDIDPNYIFTTLSYQ